MAGDFVIKVQVPTNQENIFKEIPVTISDEEMAKLIAHYHVLIFQASGLPEGITGHPSPRLPCGEQPAPREDDGSKGTG